MQVQDSAPTTLPSDLPHIGSGYSGGLGLLQGKVADQSGLAIASAEIKVDGAHTNVFTNSSGGYQISINPGMHRIEAEKAGYGIMPRAVQVLQGQVNTLDLVGKKTANLGY